MLWRSLLPRRLFYCRLPDLLATNLLTFWLDHLTLIRLPYRWSLKLNPWSILLASSLYGRLLLNLIGTRNILATHNFFGRLLTPPFPFLLRADCIHLPALRHLWWNLFRPRMLKTTDTRRFHAWNAAPLPLSALASFR